MTIPFIVGIAGGSCSGKTSLVSQLQRDIGPENCSVLLQDNYYFDKPQAQDKEFEFNFDHPDALDFERMANDLKGLRDGIGIESPSYDFALHVRTPGATVAVPARPVVLIDGILILTQSSIRSLLDLALFVHCNSAERLARRVLRDTKERGRKEENVIAQFKRQVQPMHERFVEPSAEHADIVLNQDELSKELTGESQRILSLCRAKAKLI
ncbi:MAG: uridine kinase [Pseudomonadota bacterium]